MTFERHFKVDEDFWEDLLGHIEEGNLLPIVGQGITTFGDDDAPLMPWLAQRLADRLSLSQADLPEQPSLNDVVTRHILNGESRDTAYTRLFRVLRDAEHTPGPTLRRLASVRGLRLFINATSDSLLERALNTERSDGRETTQVCEYSPAGESKDLPARMDEIRRATVFHILGRAAPQVDAFVAWDEDLLEFICGLNAHLVPDVMPHLSRDLADRNVRVLAIGLNFSDWLLRFFLRVVRQNRLTLHDQGMTWLAQSNGMAKSDSHVVFFGDVAKRVAILETDPRKFVAELADRWAKKHPPNETPEQTPIERRVENDMPPGAIFVSYVREDEGAANELVGRLQKAGCDVWLDLERLKSGMNFDRRIRKYVTEDCSLFVSVISRETESQREAYFHKERNWAGERAQSFSDADRDEFYHPVIIDEIVPGDVKREPDEFSGVHRPQFLDGKVPDEFCRRLFALQNRYREDESHE